VERADAWLDETCRAIDPARPLAGQIATRVDALPAAALHSWAAEACIGSYPLQVVAASGPTVQQTPGDGAVLTVSLLIDGGSWLGAGPIVARAG
jgi:hypothetical protein